MELKEGYKQTEVGVIPEDWEVATLETLGEFKNGINKDKDSFGSGYPFVNLLDVFGNTHINLQDVKLSLVESSAQERSGYNLRKGDILFVRSSVKPEGVGLTTVLFDDFPNAVFSGFLIRFRSNDRLDILFKEQCFNETNFRKRLIENSTVSANTNINQQELKKLLIALPPSLSEQRAIATVLSDVDALLSSLNALIAKKRDIKTAAMQELLTGRKRLPGFSGEWVEKNLSSVAMIVGGGTPSTSEPSYWNGSIPWFTPAEISTAEKYISHSERQISELGLDKSSAKLLPVGTILLTTRASIGLRAILTVPAATNQGFQSLIVHRDTDNEFIYYLLEIIQPELLTLASGSTFLEISPRKLGTIALRLPASLGEQHAIAAVLSDMDAEIAALESRRAKVLALKQGMMQELLTGRTRLLPEGE